MKRLHASLIGVDVDYMATFLQADRDPGFIVRLEAKAAGPEQQQLEHPAAKAGCAPASPWMRSPMTCTLVRGSETRDPFPLHKNTQCMHLCAGGCATYSMSSVACMGTPAVASDMGIVSIMKYKSHAFPLHLQCQVTFKSGTGALQRRSKFVRFQTP